MPAAMLAGKAAEIHQMRDKKLETARERRVRSKVEGRVVESGSASFPSISKNSNGRHDSISR